MVPAIRRRFVHTKTSGDSDFVRTKLIVLCSFIEGFILSPEGFILSPEGFILSPEGFILSPEGPNPLPH